MNKKYFNKSINILKEELLSSGIDNILETCKNLGYFANTFTSINYQTFGETQASQSKRAEILSRANQCISKEKQDVTYRKLIIDCYQVESRIRSFIASFDNNDAVLSIMEKFLKNLEEFQEIYEGYRVNFSAEFFHRLSFLANILANSIENLLLSINLLLSMSESTQADNDLFKLELYLSNVTTLKAFGIKLEAIEAIYIEICHLFDISIIDNPLIIEHIENGSLWVKVAGHALTATVLTTILNAASSYYQENFTVTGKINQLPNSVNVVNDLLKISEQLKKNGYNTDEINDEINSATKKIARKLDLLLGDQPTIEINDKVHDVGDHLRNKLLEQSELKLLKNQDEII